MISLTEAAANKIEEFFGGPRNASGKPINIRIKVAGGGCSGFQYEINFDEIKDDDQVFEHFGVNVICDPKSHLYLEGTKIDYIDGLINAGFKITNPNSKGSCGCGQSFGV